MPTGIGYELASGRRRTRLAGLIATPLEDANGQIVQLLVLQMGDGERASSKAMQARPLGTGLWISDRRSLSGRAMRLCLFEPEIAGNVGAIMRLGACFGIPVDLIEPMGFEWDDKRVRRTAIDYIDHVAVTRHASFEAFREVAAGRLILFTTKGDTSPYEFSYRADDILLFGKESGGVPPDVAALADARLRIPIRPEVRSFNLATSAALALGEALRQTGGLPK